MNRLLYKKILSIIFVVVITFAVIPIASQAEIDGTYSDEKIQKSAIASDATTEYGRTNHIEM